MKQHASDFKVSLTKLLPGYKWTVHKPTSGDLLATGIQSAGFNRLSTMEVKIRADWFECRIAGYGTRSVWLHSGSGSTLAKAVRSLQEGLAHRASIYAAQASNIQQARTTA